MCNRKIKVQTRTRDGGVRHTAYFHSPDNAQPCQWIGAGTFSDKERAKAEARRGYEDARKPGWINPAGSRTLLKNYAESTFFEGGLTVADNTYKSYRSVFNNHICPEFGGREMGDIRYTEIKAWINKMEQGSSYANGKVLKKPVGRVTQRKAFVVLALILKSARRDRLIPTIETEGVKTYPLPTNDVVIFYPHEWDGFFGAVDAYWQPLVHVGRATGLRIEELRALCPKQIDWRGRDLINVDRATIQLTIAEGGPFKDKEPKDKDKREVRVRDVETMKILARAVKARGLEPTSTEKIFLTPDGQPFDYEILEGVFERACKAAEIPRRTPKHLRSTFASWRLKENGGDLKEVQEEMGHSSVTVTEKYLAVLRGVDGDLAEVISFEDYLKDDDGPDTILEEAQ